MISFSQIKSFLIDRKVSFSIEGTKREIKHIGYLNRVRPSSGKLSFLESEQWMKDLNQDSSVASLFVTPEIFEKNQETLKNYLCLLVDHPRVLFELHHSISYQKRSFSETTGEGTKIAPSAQISSGVSIGKNCYIDDLVVVKTGTHIGDNVYIGPGSVIGAESLEMHFIQNKHVNLQHEMGVIIGNGVRIGAQCTINCGIFGLDTQLEDEVFLDNNVCIEHSTKLCKSVKMAAGAVVGGSTLIQEGVYLGLNATVKNSISVGPHSVIGMGAWVAQDIGAKTKVMSALPKFLPLK